VSAPFGGDALTCWLTGEAPASTFKNNPEPCTEHTLLRERRLVGGKMWMQSQMLFPALSPTSNVLPKGTLEAWPVADKGLQGPSRRQGAQEPFARPHGPGKNRPNAHFTALSAGTHARARTHTHNTLAYFKKSLVVSKIVLPSNPFQRKPSPD